MSKKTDERTTPNDLFNELNREFNFNVDLASTDENAKCLVHYTKERSGLDIDWNFGTYFCNPPYSDLYRWVGKAYRQNILWRQTIIMILPCDTSTKWFHDFIWDKSVHKTRPGVELRFPQGRFKFGSYSTSPKFATIIAIFRG